MTTIKADVALIGGGIHGCSAALHLARRGYRVVQIEKDGIGQHASGVNAGGVRQLLRHPAEIPLSRASMELWRHARELVGDDCGFQEKGQVAVAETDEDLARLQARIELLYALGHQHEELLGPNELFDVLPALARWCAGGLICRSDGFVSPYQATLAFSRAAIESGAELLTQTRAVGFSRKGGIWRVDTTAGTVEATFLVNCGGAWGGAVAAALGEPVPVEAIAPMLMVCARVPHFLDPVVIGTSRKLTFKQTMSGTVVIGGGHLGTADAQRQETELDFMRLSASAQTVLDLFPVMRRATVVRAWSGIEARMPDNLPVISPSSTEDNAFHAFGFSAHGFQLGPIVGTLIADLVDTGRSSLPIDAFSITRFNGEHAHPSEEAAGRERLDLITH
ncbi:NAD(P)/FAD-dependent oxidoreductase [Sphingobium sp. SCG-1]|uniref:NAD(P)/FAD-dependent oxidoreductase n=1 Tax=Sphingobium sp. SCG-1 TaxID=2072936 RepID=UPI001CB8A52A|nr:FAD-dependent oxidoreductase [Sphingobium sp. SCG-1]